MGVPVSLPVADTAPAASAPCVFFALVGVHERSDLERRPGKFFPTPVIFRLILVLDVPMIVGSRYLRRGYCPTPLSAHRSDLIKAHPKNWSERAKACPTGLARKLLKPSSTMQSWFAIRVRSRCEKLATADLTTKGFRVCAATAPHRRVWSDRIRTVEMPLFPGYIFGCFDPADRAEIQRGAGVVGIVGACGRGYPIGREEMDSIFTLLASGVEVFRMPFLEVGARVRVSRGPLAGAVGILQQIKNGCRLIISVDFLQRSVAAELDMAFVEPLPAGPGRRLRDSDSTPIFRTG